MNRAARIASLCVAMALVPAGAEAAKFRFRGTSASAATATTGARSSLVVMPGVGFSSRATGAQPDTAQRVPFPAVAAATGAETAPPLRLSANADDAKVWCRSDVVVGGFCVLN